MVAALGSSQGGLTRGLTPSPSTGAAQEVPNRCLLGYDMDTGYDTDTLSSLVFRSGRARESGERKCASTKARTSLGDSDGTITTTSDADNPWIGWFNHLIRQQ